MTTIARCAWQESERGWGCRDDGYSLHLSIKDCEEFIADYWANMPDTPPSTYSRPMTPRDIPTPDNPKLLKKLRNSKNGLRFYD